MNRGGAVAKTPLKDGGGNPVDLGRATKSGRKVKRPAHFDDSPDAKKTGAGASVDEDSPKQRKEVVPEAVKSARKTILVKSEPETPKSNGQPEVVEATKKSARKTLVKQEEPVEEKAQKVVSSRRTMTLAASSREDSPEPPKPAKESARKTLLKSTTVKEQDTPKKTTESPKKAVKKVESVEEEPPAGPGVSRTGRKIKVPAHLKEFEDVVVASPKKEVPEKSASRKSLAPAVVKKQEPEEEKVVAAKTPGRGRSLAVPRKAAEPEPEETKEPAKVSRRGKSLAAKLDEAEDPLALPPSPEVVSPKKAKQPPKSPVKAVAVEPAKVADLAPKTPKRGRSLAPQAAAKSPVEEEKLPAKTPSKRAKSMAPTPARVPSPEKAPKTPKVVSRLVEESAEPVSRSGRKIKPKKYFGEFEEDQPEPSAVVAKVHASPVKSAVAKSSPVAKKVSHPPKKAASPVKRHQVAAEKADESPKKKPRLESKPVAEVARKLEVVSPKKKPRLEPKPVTEEVKKIDEISPNTEERLITKRGVNDHHHPPPVKAESPTKKTVPAKKPSEKPVSDPLAEEEHVEEEKPKRGRKTLSATPSVEEVQPEPEKPAAEPQQKRGRKTLTTAPSDDTKEEEPPKAPKKLPATSVVEEPQPEPERPAVEPQQKRGRKTLTSAPSDDTKEEEPPKAPKTLPATSSVEDTQPESEKPEPQQKRSRKTLPAPTPSSDDRAEEEEEPSKAPKTPVASRRVTTAATTPAPTEDAGSSRSGRKIKPKKFFGEEEETVKVATTKPPKATVAAATPGSVNGGRGKRKTLAAELPDKEVEESKKTTPPVVEVAKAAPKQELGQCPSREEILAVVGVVDPVEEMMEELHTGSQDQPTPMEAEDQQAEEATPVGHAQESTEDNNTREELKASEPVEENVPMATDDEVPTVQSLREDEIQPVEPVVEESLQEPDPADDEESTHPEAETVESALEENFQEASVPQTSPAPCPPTEEVPTDPAPLPEDPPLVEPSAPEGPPLVAEELPTTTESTQELQSMPDPDPEPQSETTISEDPEPSGDVQDQPIDNAGTKQEQVEPVPANQQTELSASSSFSEALVVEDDAAEQSASVADDSKGQQYESVEFLELSGASTAGNEQHPVDAEPLENADDQEQRQELQQQQQAEEQLQKRITTPELEDDIDKTEVPPMDDIDDEKEEELLEDVPEPTDESFLERDRDNESIIVIPDTPKPPTSEAHEDLDLDDKVSSSPQTPHGSVGRVELSSSPVVMKDLVVPSTPRTPESKVPQKTSTCSPDKPEDQEQANIPLDEVIEISDSPIATVMKSELTDCKPGSTTSTPLKMGSKMSVKDRLIENSRKRSLSVDSELIKKNVTFHSPANSTILVDTLDERLKKKNESGTKSKQGPRKRSFSEHKDPRHVSNDGPKPAKISKLPNFKSIHQQQFNRMESIEEFHNRKVQRAKEILANSAVKSPAAMALVRGERPPLQKASSLPPKSPHKATGNGTNGSSSTSKIARPPHMAAKSTDPYKPLSDAERQEKRQKQFQAAFKPGGSSTDKDTPDGTHRVIEQSRHKQNQILKGVRTNKRFELLMKFRDAQE